MAKDPAFLFYSSDFLTGTVFMTHEQVGIYILLLCYQHQHGGLVDKESFNKLVGENKILRNKFIEDENGFYNKRLMVEMEKRSQKSSNLSENAKKGWEKRKCIGIASALHRHMPIENDNANALNGERNPEFKGTENPVGERSQPLEENVVSDDIGVSSYDKSKKQKKTRFAVPTVTDVKNYCDERVNNIDPQRFIDFYEARGWMIGKNSMKDWKAAVRLWERNHFNVPAGKPKSEAMKKFEESLLD